MAPARCGSVLLFVLLLVGMGALLTTLLAAAEGCRRRRRRRLCPPCTEWMVPPGAAGARRRLPNPFGGGGTLTVAECRAERGATFQQPTEGGPTGVLGCALRARAAGRRLFALARGGECWLADHDDVDAVRGDPSTACDAGPASRDPDTGLPLGGADAGVQVYLMDEAMVARPVLFNPAGRAATLFR